MNRQYLRALAQHQAAEDYLRNRHDRGMIASLNPAIIAQQGERDPDRGTNLAALPNGGTIRTALNTTNGGLPISAVLPSTLLSPGNSATSDARPA